MSTSRLLSLYSFNMLRQNLKTKQFCVQNPIKTESDIPFSLWHKFKSLESLVQQQQIQINEMQRKNLNMHKSLKFIGISGGGGFFLSTIFDSFGYVFERKKTDLL